MKIAIGILFIIGLNITGGILLWASIQDECWNDGVSLFGPVTFTCKGEIE